MSTVCDVIKRPTVRTYLSTAAFKEIFRTFSLLLLLLCSLPCVKCVSVSEQLTVLLLKETR